MRQRITYFCNVCQAPTNKSQRPLRRRHKLEMPFCYPDCLCGTPARMAHVFHYGRDHGRIFFSCREPQQSKMRCRYRCYLDETEFVMPKCACQTPKPMVLRRVMGLVDNGRYFGQCANKLCKRRIWLVPSQRPSSGEQDNHESAVSLQRQRWSYREQDKEESAVSPQKQRWSHHKKDEPHLMLALRVFSSSDPRPASLSMDGEA